MSKFNLKEMFTRNEYGTEKHWLTFKFEVVYSKSGVAKIYINNRETFYKVGGYGYDKESSVIAKMINDITLPTKYKKGVYGHRDGFLSAGTGFSSIQESFNSKRGNKLEKIYSGFNCDVYEIKINSKYIVKGK